jgi:hypothetical protein
MKAFDNKTKQSRPSLRLATAHLQVADTKADNLCEAFAERHEGAVTMFVRYRMWRKTYNWIVAEIERLEHSLTGSRIIKRAPLLIRPLSY